MHSFVQDTTDFIRKLEIMGDILDGSLMCTMDVNSLYTSIPHEEGNMDDLMVFKERLDGCLDTISYTLEYDLHEMHFLDVNLQRHKSLRDHLMKNVNLQGKTHTAETWLSAIPDWSYSGHLDHGTCGVRVLEHIESIRMYHHTR
ncbi:uncharacterized protein LOC134572173 isoform X2 [Pelobates fuscus]|uniref:uncharacterized protein LOC134572173 isoform X2 n=1 Tax=Pelobates fuscus TaxID=191477 RepID=UPI002FE44495